MKRSSIIILTALSLTAGSLAVSQTNALYTFTDIVTDSFVERAMQVVIQECQWEDLSYSLIGGMCWRIRQQGYSTYFLGLDASSTIEHAVWVGYREPDRMQEQAMQTSLAWKIYRNIVEAITKQFSDPEYLRHFYERHKPAFIKGLREAGKAELAALRFSVAFHGLDDEYNGIMERRKQQNPVLPAAYQEILRDLIAALREEQPS